MARFFSEAPKSKSQSQEIQQQRTTTTLLDQYLGQVCHKHIRTDLLGKAPLSCTYCKGVDLVIVQCEGYSICRKCNSVQYIVVDHDKPSYKDPPKEISYYAYKRLNHFNEWLNQTQGKETTEIPDDVFDQILLEIRKRKVDNMANLKHNMVRTILKKLDLSKYYEHIYYIINRLNGIPMPHFSPELEEQLRNMFLQMQAPFRKHMPPDRKNFFSYPYVLHKFVQLLGHDKYLANFPLLKCREKLHKQDQLWNKICEELNWQFIKSL
jgi:hypothetical protein